MEEHGPASAPAPATAIYILLLHTSDRADNHSHTDALLLLVGRILMRQRLVKERKAQQHTKLAAIDDTAKPCCEFSALLLLPLPCVVCVADVSRCSTTCVMHCISFVIVAVIILGRLCIVSIRL